MLRSQHQHTTIPPSLGTSPPSIHYTHIDHALVSSSSQEQYSKLGHSGPALTPEYSKLNHSHTLPTKTISVLHPSPPHMQLCSHCSARQAATMPHLHHMSGQVMHLSTSPSSPSHITPPHTSHTLVTSYQPGCHHNPPLSVVSKSLSAESSCPNFQSTYRTEVARNIKIRSHSITSPTLL